VKAYQEDTGVTGTLYKGFRSNNRLTAFLVCLLIAAICWIFTSLSKSYTGSFVFDLRYRNLPFQKNITNELPTKIAVEMEARGFDLIAYSFRQKLDHIDVDVGAMISSANPARNSLLIQSRSLISAEVMGMKPEMSIRHINPEFITFDFSQKFRKKVPVLPDVSVSYKKQFYGPFHWIVKPDSVEIAGSQELIGKIKGIHTEHLEVTNLDHKAIIPVRMKDLRLTGMEIAPSTVWVYFPVEELGEEVLEVPVEMVNGPAENMLLIPDRVMVTYQAPLRLIDQINTEEFRVCGDIAKYGDQYAREARLELCHIPAGVYKARISPGFIKYLTSK